jgi:hypothetical protein
MKYDDMNKKRREDFAQWSKDSLKIELTEWQLDFLFPRQRGTSTARLARLIYRIVKSKKQKYLYRAVTGRQAKEMWHKVIYMLRDSSDVEKMTKEVIIFKNGSTLEFQTIETKCPKESDVTDDDFMDLNDLTYNLPQL